MPLERIVTGDEFAGYKRHTLLKNLFPQIVFGDLEDAYAEEFYLKKENDLPEIGEQLKLYAYHAKNIVKISMGISMIFGTTGGLYSVATPFLVDLHSPFDIVKEFEVFRAAYTGLTMALFSISGLFFVNWYRNRAFYHKCNARLENLRVKNESQN